MTSESISIDIDRKHLAIRTRGHWQVCRKDDQGIYRPIADWDGPRKSVFSLFAELKITPSRDAEIAINSLPEQPAFRDDPPRRGQMPTIAV